MCYGFDVKIYVSLFCGNLKVRLYMVFIIVGKSKNMFFFLINVAMWWVFFVLNMSAYMHKIFVRCWLSILWLRLINYCTCGICFVI